MKLAVLNPGGHDPQQLFPDGAGAPDDAAHAPVNYHAYAACSGGGFYREVSEIPESQREVLLLIRRDVKTCYTALEALQAAGKTVAVSLKESGAHQFAELCSGAKRLALFSRICAQADGALSSTPELVAVYRGAGAKRVEFIPTPYPIDDPRWDFAIPAEERRGVFIGTREFDVPSRNHLAALVSLHELKIPVTVVNGDGRHGRKLLHALANESLNIVEDRLPYSDYLRLIARHRFVFQLDRSAVPGQVAGDSLLAGVPCVGGDGAIERVAFPETNGHGRDAGQLVEIARRLLAEPSFYAQINTSAQKTAREQLSFGVIAARLADFFATLKGD